MASGNRRASRTAIMTAVVRALHRDEPPPWVLDDYLALPLAGEEGLEIRSQLVDALPPENLRSFSRWVCVRSRYTEDLVARGLTGGNTTQYVILGAGLDTFAYRHPDLMARLRVFEVDHPESQAWKQVRLRTVHVTVPANLTFAPTDFEHQTLRLGLQDAGVDFGQPTIVSWIGVTMYLTREAIDATLATINAFPPPSRLVLTYNLPLSRLSGLGRDTQSVLRGVAAGMGEPFVSLFEPDEIDRLLRRHRYTDIEHFGPDEAVATYFAGRSDVHLGGAQRLATATGDRNRE
jgi:methyltransferase (TIGR00027 family)